MTTALNKKQKNLELLIMAHRYLYYVECCPKITDSEYDKLEVQVRALLPETSPVHRVGSSLASSYTPEQVAKANSLMGE